jgi:uncharacterized protein (TIGR02145 family)
MKKQIGDYAYINGIKLKRENETLSTKSLFTYSKAIKVAERVGDWLPTKEEWKQMFKPGHTWDGEKKGIWIGANHAMKAETDFSTFLPAAGFKYYNGDGLYSQGSYGYYWSSTVKGTKAYHLNFYSGGANPNYISRRGHGFSVRCVVSD